MKGVNEWLKKLERMEKEFPEYADRALTDEANLLLGEVKKLTPIGKYTNPVRFTTRAGKEVSFKVKAIPPGGQLRAAWIKQKVDKFKHVIFNNTHYAAHVEYGHRIIQGGKMKGTVKGRYMLYRAMKASDKRFPKALNTIIRKLFG